MFKEKTLYNIEMVCCIYLLTNQDGYGYIGKTKNLKHRLSGHNGKANPTKSKLLGEHKECIILEECDEDCLDDYEQYYYDMYREIYPDKIVNRIRPLQTKKEWYEANRERFKDYYKNNYQVNRENILLYHIEYQKANHETISEYQKQYRKANRQKLNEYNKRYRQEKLLKEIPNK